MRGYPQFFVLDFNIPYCCIWVKICLPHMCVKTLQLKKKYTSLLRGNVLKELSFLGESSITKRELSHICSLTSKKKVFYTYGNVEGMFVFLNNNSLTCSRKLTLIIVDWMVRNEMHCNLKNGPICSGFSCVFWINR